MGHPPLGGFGTKAFRTGFDNSQIVKPWPQTLVPMYAQKTTNWYPLNEG